MRDHQERAGPRSDLCAPPNLAHLRALTTDSGIWQHASGTAPDPAHGYAIDDVARALIVVNTAARLFPELNEPPPGGARTLADLAEVYLCFLERCQRAGGRFHNFVSATGEPQDEEGGYDSFGRTVWALSDTVAGGITDDHRRRAKELLTRAQPHIAVAPYVRTNGFLLLGLAALGRAAKQDPLRARLPAFLRDLIERYERCAADDWQWCETILSYSNGLYPLALFVGARAVRERTPDLERTAVLTGVRALEFLLSEAVHDGVPAPIGNKGWYTRGGQKPLYDQQPVDAAAMALACIEAWRATSDPRYRTHAEAWLRWYEGNNVRGASLLEENGAVHDGINEDGINPNCGAESVVTYLLARLAWAEHCCGG